VRALGIDLGSKRIGIAISDRDGTVATPVDVVARTRDRQATHRTIAGLVAEWEAEIVVVGMPYRLDGQMGPAAIAAQAEADELADTLGVPVETYDERLTTVTAQRSIIEMQMSPEARRKVVDKIAAAVMLQSWLDHRRSVNRPEDPLP
jgi:putative Holliday junction resolvase